MNENQKIVLDWLKDSEDYPFAAVSDMFEGNELPLEVSGSYFSLTRKEEIEVLAAFAEWGLKQ
jgi:hypothetical protein